MTTDMDGTAEDAARLGRYAAQYFLCGEQPPPVARMSRLPLLFKAQVEQRSVLQRHSMSEAMSQIAVVRHTSQSYRKRSSPSGGAICFTD
jgi:hypothetical protein